ncbi:MAG: type II secretion system F family protein [Geminicoccaceae bacterium]|nr:type II secretion system F family protein [Geminicoccaceae bacterium]
MPLFAYRALTASGERVTGEIEAADGRAAVARLHDLGLIPISAEPVALKPATAPLASRRLARAVTEASRELATLLGAGQPVEAALTLLLETGEQPRLRAILASVRDAVRGGKPLSEAMAAHPEAFSRAYVGMVRAGEAAGTLPEVLRALVGLRERSEQLERKLASAMIYPAVLFAASVVALLVLLLVVVPRFAPLFAQAGAALPASTRATLALASLLSEHGAMLGLATLLLVLGGLAATRRPAIRLRLDRALLAAPGLGRLARERATAQAMRGLATLLKGGLDLAAALTLVRDMLANHAARAAMEGVVVGVRQGRPLWSCLAGAGIVAPLAVRLVRVGEESGRLAAVAEHLAEAFEERLATRLTRLVALIEPLVIVTLGFLVGGIVVSILAAVVAVNDLAF